MVDVRQVDVQQAPARSAHAFILPGWCQHAVGFLDKDTVLLSRWRVLSPHCACQHVAHALAEVTRVDDAANQAKCGGRTMSVGGREVIDSQASSLQQQQQHGSAQAERQGAGTGSSTQGSVEWLSWSAHGLPVTLVMPSCWLC